MLVEFDSNRFLVLVEPNYDFRPKQYRFQLRLLNTNLIRPQTTRVTPNDTTENGFDSKITFDSNELQSNLIDFNSNRLQSNSISTLIDSKMRTGKVVHDQQLTSKLISIWFN